MIELTEQLNKACNYLLKQEFEQAYLVLNQLQQQYPQQAEVALKLGLLASQLGQWQTGTTWLETAVKLAPDNPECHFNLANALKAQNQSAKAKLHYLQALQLFPNYAQAHNNLGNLFYHQQDFQQALQHYAAAVQAQPDYLQAHFNLGMLFLRRQENDAAIKQFCNVVTLDPNSASAHFYLASLYLQQERFTDAIQHYQQVLALVPDHIDAMNNLGAIYLKQNHFIQANQLFGQVLHLQPTNFAARSNLAASFLNQDRYTEAAWSYQQLLQHKPDDDESLFNLGVAQMALGELSAAIASFEAVLRLQPDNAAAHQNLGAIFLRLKQRDKAVSHYEKSLALTPDDAVVNYQLTALLQQTIPKHAPENYIAQLFDNYASYFEHHALSGLDYQVPKQIYTALQSLLMPEASYRILDLGCGTGLLGAAVKTFAAELIGVDLSEKMLAQAQQKQIYQELHHSELVTYLKQQHARFDLILAADVLVYFGDLADVLLYCHQALSNDGILIFTTEITDEADYCLQPTARYAHRKSYLQKLADIAGFTVKDIRTITTRQQQQQALPGYLAIFSKRFS